jgi:hypothetical protein
VTRIDHLAPQFVETIPPVIEPGVLYISITYKTCGHLCCCGCGEEVFTPLSRAQWALTYDGESVSLAPSVGNWSLRCQSHYVISRGQVQWARKFAPRAIADNRASDQRALAVAEARRQSATSRPPVRGWLSRLAVRLRPSAKQGEGQR